MVRTESVPPTLRNTRWRCCACGAIVQPPEVNKTKKKTKTKQEVEKKKKKKKEQEVEKKKKKEQRCKQTERVESELNEKMETLSRRAVDRIYSAVYSLHLLSAYTH